MWWCDRLRPLALLLALGPCGCGFAPLYGEGTAAAGLPGRIAVDPLDGGPGFALRERLTRRLGDGTAADWRLEVDLELERQGVALTRENVTTHFDVIGTADFALRPAGGGLPAVAGQVRAVTTYSAPVTETSSAFASEVAARAAELRVARTLADKIALRLAVAADRLGPSPSPSPPPAAAAVAAP